MRTVHKRLVKNARSHGNLQSRTDHKLVKTTADLKLYKCHKKKIVNSKFDTKKLQDLNTRENFQNLQKKYYEENMRESDDEIHPQKHWDNIVDACIRAAKETALHKKHQHKSDNPEIKKLSEEQKKIRNKIDSIKDPEMIRKRETKIIYTQAIMRKKVTHKTNNMRMTLDG